LAGICHINLKYVSMSVKYLKWLQLINPIYKLNVIILMAISQN
jgi:hypothetical protein